MVQVVTHTPESLAAFRDRVVQAFLRKQIRSPIHLPSDTQAKPLIEIFKRFRPGVDHLFSGWRSMWHAILAGVPEEAVFDAILQGRSMFLCFRQHKVFCSSVVAGNLPIAAGVALAIKRRGSDEKVFCFAGDMTSRCGLFHEFREYCGRHDLPVRICVEDNSFSTDSPTKIVWGDKEPHEAATYVSTDYYRYERQFPHVGCNEFVVF